MKSMGDGNQWSLTPLIVLTSGMPMGSQFELSTLVYLEAIIADNIAAKSLTEEGMRAIHANLE